MDEVAVRLENIGRGPKNTRKCQSKTIKLNRESKKKVNQPDTIETNGISTGRKGQYRGKWLTAMKNKLQGIEKDWK